MRHWIALLVFCAGSSSAFGQSFEASASFGRSVFPGTSKDLGTVSTNTNDAQYTMKDGFSMALRMTINSWRFFGTEFGYGYNHTGIHIPTSTSTATLGLPGQTGVGQAAAQDIIVPIHQGFGDFLAYATPEGTHIRPFAAGGLHFSSFFPPGSSIYSGNQTTKFGFHYGGGVKVRVTSIWGFRLDARYYNTGKPFNFPNQSGLLKQLEVTAGVTFNLM
jgi:opacity protein-like surface antigen